MAAERSSIPHETAAMRALALATSAMFRSPSGVSVAISRSAVEPNATPCLSSSQCRINASAGSVSALAIIFSFPPGTKWNERLGPLMPGEQGPGGAPCPRRGAPPPLRYPPRRVARARAELERARHNVSCGRSRHPAAHHVLGGGLRPPSDASPRGLRGQSPRSNERGITYHAGGPGPPRRTMSSGGGAPPPPPPPPPGCGGQ